MAKKAKQKEEGAEDPQRAELKDLLVRAKDRFKVMSEADQENRSKALEDIKFIHVPGEQWDPALKKERGDRPCYEFNKLRVTCKRVINNIRSNRPQWKVRAVEDGDKPTADVYDGLMRNIWNTSDGDSVVDYAAEYVVSGGMGAWRVTTEYSDDTAFEQDIFIRAIKNPFCLYADPSASDMLARDAEDWVLTEKISNSSYEKRWPKAKRTNFEDVSFDADEDWRDENETRIAEYWYKKPYERTLYLLADGKTVEEVPEGAQVIKERVVKGHKICMVIVSGDAILEGPTEWAGRYFPFVKPHGEWVVIDGKVQWYGLTRHSKDPQRAYNFEQTAIKETIAQAPTAKFWMTPEQYKGMDKHIAEAHKKNLPVTFYNPDPKSPGPPARMGGADVPVALFQAALNSSEDIKATSGIFDNSLGQQGNESSGRAISARQQQGEIATYNYMDNISKAHRFTGEILIDLVPHIIDTARAIRILGPDGAEKYVKVNTPTQDPQTGEIRVENDLTRGKYDLTVTTGPSYSTQRQEAAETFTQLVQAFPQMMAVAGDLVVKNMDIPGSEQLAERLQAMLPPQIQQQIAKDKPVPPEVQAVMNQAQQAMAIVQQQSQLVQAAAVEAEQGKMEAEKAASQVDQKIADLKVAQAQFEANIAKELAKLAQKEASLQVAQAQVGMDAERNEETAKANEAKGADTSAVAQQAALSTAAITELLIQFQTIAAGIMEYLAKQPGKTTRQLQAQRGPNGSTNFSVNDVDEMGQVVSSRTGSLTRGPNGLTGQLD